MSLFMANNKNEKRLQFRVFSRLDDKAKCLFYCVNTYKYKMYIVLDITNG